MSVELPPKTRIQTLPELLNLLDTAHLEEYGQLYSSLDLKIDEFLPYAEWNSHKYTRNCLHRTDNYELILLCWESGQATAIHCHNNQKCWVSVLDGHLKENLYYKDDKGTLIHRASHVLAPGQNSFMTDSKGFHSLENNFSSRALSLHLYCRPIDRCTVYDPESRGFRWVNLKYTNT